MGRVQIRDIEAGQANGIQYTRYVRMLFEANELNIDRAEWRTEAHGGASVEFGWASAPNELEALLAASQSL